MRNYEGQTITISAPFLLLYVRIIYIHNVPSWTSHTIFWQALFFFTLFTKSALPRKKFQMPGKHAKVKSSTPFQALAFLTMYYHYYSSVGAPLAKKVLTRMKQTEESPRSQALLW